MRDSHPEKPLIPLNSLKPAKRQILVQRQVVPTVNRMLQDAYQTLGNQLALFQQNSHREQFDVKSATAFNKLVSSLTTLQNTERQNTALLKLGELSEAELHALAAQASEIIKPEEDR